MIVGIIKSLFFKNSIATIPFLLLFIGDALQITPIVFINITSEDLYISTESKLKKKKYPKISVMDSVLNLCSVRLWSKVF